MKKTRELIFLCLAPAMLAAAQVAPVPAPPRPPASPAAPVPPAPPIPTAAPLPPAPPDPFDFNFDFDFDFPDLNLKLGDLNLKLNDKMAQLNAKLSDRFGAEFFQRAAGVGAGIGAGVGAGIGRGPGRGTSNEERQYANAQRNLDRNDWAAALTAFTQIADAKGSRADGALYWKAYTLGKLGRRDDALAALADLKKSYPMSRWLDDANALQIEVQQAAGQNVSPEAQSDEELKLMALNALVSSDPDRAVPLLENLLKGSQSPRVKERALFVLAQSSSPRAQQLLEQYAKGSGNPDLQLKAIQYLGMMGRRQGTGQSLFDIYASTNDAAVKKAILRTIPSMQGDTDRLVQLIKNEKSPELKAEGIRYLAGKSEADEALVQIWDTEQDRQVKRSILDALHANRDAKRMVDLARKEKDQEMKREIVQRLASMMKSSKEANDYMLELLK
jgi:hypothetical protein